MSKVRPALIVQGDAIAAIHTVVAQITGARQRMLPSRLLIDPAIETGSGLRMPSLVVCEQLYTVRMDRILRTIGTLSSLAMAQVDERLRAALGLT